MTVEQARRDLPPTHDGCYHGYAATAPPPTQRCRLTPAGGSRTIALVGDSHAVQWLPAFTEAARQHGWTLYFFAKSECAVADVAVYLSKERGRYTACDTWREQVLRQLAAIDGLDAVFVGRWQSYRTHTMAHGRRLDAGEMGATWKTGMARLMRALTSVPKVVVLRDTPWPGFDVPSCLSTHLDDPQRCAFPRHGHVGLDDPLVAAERAAGGARLAVLDLDDLVCPRSTCPVVTRDGTIVYRDAHHLSATYSARIGAGVADRLASVLAG
jgi:hypothetical protein